jgi:adenylylsulfate kinase
MARKILVMGLPGAGKTTLSRVLAKRIGAVHFESDAVRANINRDLGFSVDDRIEQARRMGWLCDQVVAAGTPAIADFICPTVATREAFGTDAFVVWVERITEGRFADTNRLFESPERVDVQVTPEGAPEYWAETIAQAMHAVFDPGKPTALFVGRYQPFHNGHKALIEEGIRRVGQACVAVRETHGQGPGNPLPFEQVAARIEMGLRHQAGRFTVVRLPNITHIFYGRDVGYRVERIELDDDLQQISATEIRKMMQIG